MPNPRYIVLAVWGDLAVPSAVGIARELEERDDVPVAQGLEVEEFDLEAGLSTEQLALLEKDVQK